MIPVRCKLWASEMLSQDIPTEKNDGSFLYKVIFSVGSLLFCIGVFTFTVYNLNEIKNVRDELEQLKLQLDEMEQLKLQLEELAVFDEIDYNEIEDAYMEYDEKLKLGPDAILTKALEEEYTMVDDVDAATKKPAGSLTKDLYRNKRSVVAETADGVPINSDSYDHAKKQNKSGKFEHQIAPITQSGFHSPAWISHHKVAELKHYEEMNSKPSTAPPKPIQSRKSRVMHLDDKRKAFKQYVKRPVLKSLDNIEEQVGAEEVTVMKTHKGRHRKNKQRLETMDETQFSVITPNRRSTAAAHYNGNTSKYIVGQHTNFNGNGHLKHPSTTYIDFEPTEWMDALKMDQHFLYNEGVLTVKEPGLYLVYAQIYYLDVHDTNGFRVFKNKHPFLQCTVMTHSGEKLIKGNTCYTSGVEYIAPYDTISVVDISEGRYSLFQEGKSFFGVVKLADARLK